MVFYAQKISDSTSLFKNTFQKLHHKKIHSKTWLHGQSIRSRPADAGLRVPMPLFYMPNFCRFWSIIFQRKYAHLHVTGKEI